MMLLLLLNAERLQPFLFSVEVSWLMMASGDTSRTNATQCKDRKVRIFKKHVVIMNVIRKKES